MQQSSGEGGYYTWLRGGWKLKEGYSVIHWTINNKLNERVGDLGLGPLGLTFLSVYLV